MSVGVDTTVFKPHSCPSASVSKAKVNDVLTSVILEKGCWKRDTDIINGHVQKT